MNRPLTGKEDLSELNEWEAGIHRYFDDNQINPMSKDVPMETHRKFSQINVAIQKCKDELSMYHKNLEKNGYIVSPKLTGIIDEDNGINSTSKNEFCHYVACSAGHLKRSIEEVETRKNKEIEELK